MKTVISDHFLSLVVSLIGLVGFWLVIASFVVGPSKPKFSDTMSQFKTTERINKHLKSIEHTSRVKQWQNLKEHFEASQAVVEMLPENKGTQLERAMDLQQENPFKSREDLNGSDRVSYEIADTIEHSITQKERLQDYNNKYSKEFLREFVGNAKRQGYVVKLNHDLDVIGVRKLRRDQALRIE